MEDAGRVNPLKHLMVPLSFCTLAIQMLIMTTRIITRQSRIKKFIKVFFITAAVLAAAVFAAFKLSPWPSALLIRSAFNKDAIKVNQALEKHVPAGITALQDIQYDPNDKDALLDAYFPPGITPQTKLPVIVWFHGGGWISGNKGQVGNYCKILAGKGYTVISIDYTIAPEKHYPVPVQQANTALGFIAKNAEQFHADTAKFVLAGDSGGAHIAAQTANLTVSASYAALMHIQPTLPASSLAGMLLFCGPYDTRKINLDGSFGSFLTTVLWSYSGEKDFMNSHSFATASVIDYISNNFPPSFISVGNADPLEPNSRDLARALKANGIYVDTLFYPKNHTPALEHEYQFTLDDANGQLALQRADAFLKYIVK